MKIALCTPHGGKVPPEYNRRVQLMENACRQHEWLHAEVDMMIVGKARNMLIEISRPYNPDVYLFIDQDTLPPAHAWLLCDQAAELGIVSGLYFNRRPPYTPQAYTKATEPELKGMYWPLMEYAPGGLMVVDAVGGGLLAVHRTVIDNMETLFKDRKTRVLEDLRKHLDATADPELRFELEWLVEYSQQLSPWFEFLDKKGEDLYFCERAKEVGYVTWLNVDVKAGHLGEVELGEQHFSFLKQNNMIQKVPIGTPGAGVPVIVDGAEVKDGSPNLPDSGSKAVERRNDIPGPPRRVGIGSYLLSQVPSP